MDMKFLNSNIIISIFIFLLMVCTAAGIETPIVPPDLGSFHLEDGLGNVITTSTSTDMIELVAPDGQKVRFDVLIPGDLVIMVPLTFGADNYRFFVHNENLVTNIKVGSGYTHYIFVTTSYNQGVFVCPMAASLNDVNTSCEDLVTFTAQECIAGTSKYDPLNWNLIRCTIVSGKYQVEFTGLASGAGATGGSSGGGSGVPEFSTWTMMIALLGVMIGFVMIRRRE
jgi:hypothetical protein